MIYFQSHSFRFGWPREASRLEAKTHEAEAKTHEAEAEGRGRGHNPRGEAEAEAMFFGLEAEARPRGLTSLPNEYINNKTTPVVLLSRIEGEMPFPESGKLYLLICFFKLGF